jgi:hypothetical protein
MNNHNWQPSPTPKPGMGKKQFHCPRCGYFKYNFNGKPIYKKGVETLSKTPGCLY